MVIIKYLNSEAGEDSQLLYTYHKQPEPIRPTGRCLFSEAVSRNTSKHASSATTYKTCTTMADQVLEHYLSLVNSFTDFLTVATHTILYERGIYPRESFMSARKYNYAVKQNRHPAVCKFVDDAIAAVRTELLKVSCHLNAHQYRGLGLRAFVTGNGVSGYL